MTTKEKLKATLRNIYKQEEKLRHSKVEIKERLQAVCQHEKQEIIADAYKLCSYCYKDMGRATAAEKNKVCSLCGKKKQSIANLNFVCVNKHCVGNIEP